MYNGTYAVIGPVDAVLPVDLKIPGNPPTPGAIIEGLLTLMRSAKKR
jgi:Ni,Fe-hydrogenase III small subunit